MSHVGAVSKAQATSVASYTVDPNGTGFTAGDTMVLVVVDNNTGGNVVTVASTSGAWTQRTQVVSGSGTGTIWTKTAAATESAVTVSNTVNSRGAAGILVRRGETFDFAGITWLDNSGAADTPSVAAKTLAVGQQALAIGWMRSSSWVTGDGWAVPTGWTERVDAIGFGNGGSALFADEWTGGGNVPATDWVTSPTAVTTTTGGAWLLISSPVNPVATVVLGGGGSMSGFVARKGARRSGTLLTGGNSSATAITGTKGGSTGGGNVVAGTDFDTGTGSVPTNGTDLYNAGNVVGTGTAVYSTVRQHSGTQSMRLRTPATTDSANRSRTFTAQGLFAFRGYLYMNALPTNAAWLPVTVNNGATAVAQLRVSTAGVIQMRDGTVATGATAALAAGTWYRIEWKVDPDPATGTQTLRIWQANVDGPVASPDLANITTTATNTAFTTVDTFATSAFGTAVVDAFWDDVAFGDTDFVGPSVSVTVVNETFSNSGGGDFNGWVGTHTHQVILTLTTGPQGSATVSKTDNDQASLGFGTATDVTAAKDALAAPVLSGGGAFTTAAFATFSQVSVGQFLDGNGGSFTATVKGGHRQVAPALAGGGGFTATVRKNSRDVVPALSGGTSTAAVTAVRKATASAVLSGGTSSPGWAAHQTTTNATSVTLSGGGAFSGWVTAHKTTGTFTLSEGGALSASVRKTARPLVVLSGGNSPAMGVSIRKGGRGGVLLRTGQLETGLWTFDHASPIVQFETGTFALHAGGHYTITTGAAVGWVLLEWNVSVDDHPRPHWSPLWRRVRYPHTRYGLLVYRDGRVIETPTLERIEEWDADLVISGLWYGPEDDWAAVVLRDAGYTLIAVDASSGLAGVPAR